MVKEMVNKRDGKEGYFMRKHFVILGLVFILLMLNCSVVSARNLASNRDIAAQPEYLVDFQGATIQTGVMLNDRSFVPFNEMTSCMKPITAYIPQVVTRSNVNKIPDNVFGILVARNGFVEYREGSFRVPIRPLELNGRFVKLEVGTNLWLNLDYIAMPGNLSNLIVQEKAGLPAITVSSSVSPIPVDNIPEADRLFYDDYDFYSYDSKHQRYNFTPAPRDIPVYANMNKIETGVLINGRTFISFYKLIAGMPGVNFTPDPGRTLHYMETTMPDKVFAMLTANTNLGSENTLTFDPMPGPIEMDYILTAEDGNYMLLKESPALPEIQFDYQFTIL